MITPYSPQDVIMHQNSNIPSEAIQNINTLLVSLYQPDINFAEIPTNLIHDRFEHKWLLPIKAYYELHGWFVGVGDTRLFFSIK